MLPDDQISRERLYVILLACVQFSHIVDFVILMPLGPTLMEALNIGPAKFGALVSSYNFSAAIAAICLSTISDRFDRKKLLMIGLIGFFAGALLCALAPGYKSLLTARIFTGAFGGFLNSLILAFIADLVPYVRRGKAMGILASAFSIASVIGIPIGLTIADFFGWQSTFMFNASFTFIVGVAAFIVIPSVRPKVVKESAFKVLKRYMKMLSTPDYLKAHFFIFMVSMSMFILIPFLSPYAVKNMGIETHQLKYMYLVGGLVTIITARIFGRFTDSWGALRMFMILASASMLPVILYTHAGVVSLGSYILLSSLFMTFVSGRMIPCMTLVTAVPRPSERGSFMGVLNSVRALGTAVATLISGAIIQESESGALENYNIVGYLSIGMIILTVLLAKSVHADTSGEEEIEHYSPSPQNRVKI
jgi:predicted MFS family arabinose efflux permease